MVMNIARVLIQFFVYGRRVDLDSPITKKHHQVLAYQLFSADHSHRLAFVVVCVTPALLSLVWEPRSVNAACSA